MISAQEQPHIHEPDLNAVLPVPVASAGDATETPGACLLAQPQLSLKHRAELQASGISDGMIAASGIRTVSGAEVCQMLNWTQDPGSVGTGWAIPFDDPSDPDRYWRVKLDQPRVKGDHVIKYESPRGSSNRAYRPPGFDDGKSTPLFITKGEKKALSAMSHGLNCLGLTGVWNWQKPRPRDDEGRGYGNRHLIDDLAAINWAGRDVVIAFDSDAAEKQSVELAQQKLAEALAKRGAKVRVARLPHGDGGRKLGLDDALVELGIEAVKKILDAAQEPELPQLSWPDLARLFVERCCSYFEEPTIRYWRRAFYRWVGNHYEEIEEGEIKVAVYRFLEQTGWKPCRNTAAEVMAALQAVVAIESMVEPPSSLTPYSAELSGTPLVFANGVAFLDFDSKLLEEPLPMAAAHPAWFCTGSRSFDYEPFAMCPTWDGLLESSLPDPVARRLLQQWCGYLLSGRLNFHKVLVLHGAMRAGKSIIANTMAQLVGASATATSTLKELSGDFGLSPLVGKQLLLIPDAQDRGSCLGAVERIKAISGCDRLDVNRKHKPILTNVQLQTRIVVTCNQLPRFLDPSGALHYRMLVVHFPHSFAGREDRSLPDQIQGELPGIFNWAYAGWLDLACTGFVSPPSSADILARAEHILSPIKAFLDEYCDLAPAAHVLTSDMWAAWQKWCKDTGHHPGNLQKLGNDLAGALPEVERKQIRCGGLRQYFYVGVALNDSGKVLLQQWQQAAYRRA